VLRLLKVAGPTEGNNPMTSLFPTAASPRDEPSEWVEVTNPVTESKLEDRRAPAFDIRIHVGHDDVGRQDEALTTGSDHLARRTERIQHATRLCAGTLGAVAPVDLVEPSAH
jgi:hypothetical protein